MTKSGASAGTGPAARFHATVAQLGQAQKHRARGAPAYSVYLNRPLGRRLAAAAYLLGMSPNAVSMVSAAFTFSAIVLVAAVPPGIGFGFLVAALLVVGYALDSADGQVARLGGGGSAAGEWLDHVLDCIKSSTMHLAVLIAVFRFGHVPSQLWLLVPLGFSVVAAVSFFASILNDQLKSRHTGPATVADPRASTPLRSLLGLPTDYGVLCLAFVFLGWPRLFFTIYTILFMANLCYLALAAPKWFHDMKGLQ